jgi:hypothetical protein
MTRVSDSRRRRRVTSAGGAPLAASTPPSGLGSRLSSHHPAGTARSPAWRVREGASRASGVGREHVPCAHHTAEEV